MRKPAHRLRELRDTRPLLERILNTPHLAQIVPRLPPEVLHRVIEKCGLEDCGELVALTTPGQLAAVFDLDLWLPAAPGLDERFDADRFVLWLEVMMESGAGPAAQKLAEIDVDLAAAALAQYVRVFDAAALSPSAPLDGEEVPDVDPPGDGLRCEVGGCLLVARRTGSWDAIVGVLTSLDAEHPGYFHRLMRGCRTLTNDGFEIDGCDDLLSDREQIVFDLAFDREQRRERQGYVTPAQARAFLQMSRQVGRGQDTAPPANPVARAHFRGIEWTTMAEADSGARRLPAASGAPAAPQDSPDHLAKADAVAAIVDVLLDAEIVPRTPRALLDGPQSRAPRLEHIRAHMQSAGERDPAGFSMRSQELAFLANTIASGCSIQTRALTPQEASDAAAATCNLGLENWPPHWVAANDLISVFQVGWTVLHEDVCMHTAERLIAVLTDLRCGDGETQAGLDELRVEMKTHWRAEAPWRARDALDVMAILDTPAWAALLGLIDEHPAMHAGISPGSRARAISATAFEFISENSQIAAIHEYMRLLPQTLQS
jgi:hypothetical protein